ncbi:rod shape-determining protein [Candidatus Uhrbacteria bacterium RIFCSPLOWO2_01_FULL_47_24]|uniref:Cell shape-determining protein MreB n=1 Tax=Candidatus Uhrbacteria bacterium RIFCSPLOWO2_01_FULL_47_24 TaxID=1802401 RepID=A0A1F7USK2_9BACT|nr:MAG: rod shape-determining protein [Candidatus Uhrbacteria bacterium RIFCSPHIGHO2_02_FULL_46_47]OGL75286.1 MAG: rod shape-determining protein [Candidatus Uhrbacteria bacterium RIFCSPHIGHO2_12_FULL_47_11]OGL81283.1 MAG: rod shape-determining protein [Candidatus Uhrbacteria bacterium RIFCSPLOWO2_01_FULL_47_24]OGL85170.1 MAG: rod shape-determining protein [Candidatus Uhrbacteria bacterium RIFCSPLOWO2_02_FULL_46_25]OGL92855.1 MAG: rod shape-determining protein [Candidatus Uhrbacteria bacterium R
MLNRFFGHFSKDLGIDLGTANTLVYVRDKGIVINEPTVVALNTRTDQLIAVGNKARDMVGKTPPHIVTTRPLIKGIISDFEVTEKMLKYFIEKVQEGGMNFYPRPRVIIGVPLDLTEVERKAVEDATLGAGARSVELVEEPMAAAIGARLPIKEALGTMIIDIGGGLSEVAIISLGGVVNWRVIPIAGDEMNKNIIQYARDVFNLLLGEKTAEEIKVRIGSAIELPETLEGPMRGRDLMSGLPREIMVTDAQIREALSRSIRQIVEIVKATLETTPPELVADIYERGIVMTGGGSLLKGLDKLIAKATEIPVRVADDPLTAVVRGTGIILEDESLSHEVRLPSASSIGSSIR